MESLNSLPSTQQAPPTPRAAALTTPLLGMTLAFKPTTEPELAGIPAQVIDIWPCVHSGDDLVMLEYAQPVSYQQDVIRQIAAFMSELEPVGPAAGAPAIHPAWWQRLWQVVHEG